jgi:hypothetical protein
MLAEDYLDLACLKFPAVNRVVKEYGNVAVSSYLQNFILKPVQSYQPIDDIVDVVSGYASSLLGESVAKRVGHDLAACPVALTANHHGVDFFSQSIQGSLLFALNPLTGKSPASTIPIFSCGNIPLDNLTYPQGLLLYRVPNSALDRMPRKLPLFSNKYRRRLVSVAEPLNQKMLQTAGTRLNKMLLEGEICPSLADPLQTILEEDYAAHAVMGLQNYSQQSVVLNNSIWKRILAKVKKVPDIVYLELEKIGSALLEKDLQNTESLAWFILFDKELRTHIISELDGARACWQQTKLLERLRMVNPEKQRRAINGCGTTFFWGIDNKRKRIPLCLEKNGSNGTQLRGIDDYGKTWEMPFTPESVKEGIRKDKLLPSLFTNFLVIALARGINCVGGYFQAEYLPAMQRGVVKALQNTNGYHDMAHLISGIPTEAYLSGMLTVMTRSNEKSLIPSGPVEIIAGGGLDNEDIDRMMSVTVRNAHLAALFETVPDLAVPELYRPGWKKDLAMDCSRLLEGKIVIK